MASEKITAIVESVKTMTVLELKELVDTIWSSKSSLTPSARSSAFPLLPLPLPLPPALLPLPLRKRRPSSTSS